jgi:hypothetical protein
MSAGSFWRSAIERSRPGRARAGTRREARALPAFCSKWIGPTRGCSAARARPCLAAAVRRAVVDQQHLVGTAERIQRGADLLPEGREVLALVVDGITSDRSGRWPASVIATMGTLSKQRAHGWRSAPFGLKTQSLRKKAKRRRNLSSSGVRDSGSRMRFHFR